RFDHVVTAEATVQVSDDEDATKLRIFTEKQTYRVGETVAIDVHSRVGRDQGAEGSKDRATDADAQSKTPKPTTFLGLVTYEGEEILGYRTLTISPGHNRFDIPLAHEHFPNFAVGVCVMAGNKFHSASRELQVERKLNVKLTPSAATLQP